MPKIKRTPTDTIDIRQAPPQPKGKVRPFKVSITVSRPNGRTTKMNIPDLKENLHDDVERFLNIMTFGKGPKAGM